MNKSRLESFADGVFAFAATLLVTRIVVQARGGRLGGALVHAWPQYAAYALSFLMIAIWWVNHHEFLSVIHVVNRTFLFANVAFLGGIAFLPFPTSLVAEHFHDHGLRAATIAYGLTLTANAASMGFLWFYAALGRRLITPSVDQSVVRRISRYVAPGVPWCTASTLIALASPQASLAIIAASAIFYVTGGSMVRPLAPAAS